MESAKPEPEHVDGEVKGTFAVDMLGQKYTVGDAVLYATVSGKSPVMKLAIVQNVTLFEDRVYNRVKGCTEIVDRWKVGVKETRNSRGFIRYDSYDWLTGTKTKDNVRTTYPMCENIVKVPSPSQKGE